MDNFWGNKKVLITGGTGFLGKYLVSILLQLSSNVFILDFYAPNWDISKIIFIKADVKDKDKISIVCKNKDIVFHLAAMPSIAKGKISDYYKTNVIGTRNILEAALHNGVTKIVHVSSSTVYGIPKEFPLRETSQTRPLGKYGRSKLAAEKLCREFMKRGLSVSIIRPRVIIGPGRIGIFSILFDRIRNNQAVYIIGRGDNIFQFTHVFDMALACIKAAEYEKSDLFNIGSTKVLPVKEELKELIMHAHSKSKIISAPAFMVKPLLKGLSLLGISPLVNEQFAIADKNFKLDTTRAYQLLNWQPQYSNVDSLIQAYDWYIANIGQGLSQYRNLFGVLGKFKHSKMGAFQNS
jgi:nucleoside-diphosphate-sugar epimerase